MRVGASTISVPTFLLHVSVATVRRYYDADRLFVGVMTSSTGSCFAATSNHCRGTLLTNSVRYQKARIENLISGSMWDVTCQYLIDSGNVSRLFANCQSSTLIKLRALLPCRQSKHE